MTFVLNNYDVYSFVFTRDAPELPVASQRTDAVVRGASVGWQTNHRVIHSTFLPAGLTVAQQIRPWLRVKR
jgi:hypothetical protein